MENSIAARKSWISNQTKFQPFLRRFFRWDPDARVVGRSNDFTRLGPRDEATLIGNPLSGGNGGDRRAAVEGERKSLSPTVSALLELQMNDVPDFSTRTSVGTNGSNGVQMNCRLLPQRI
ncbi:hypothetical protein AVEN_104200-1 [Araneus ventricosus]|uniref:Uncharacterized protein n=1 Tax=Araneus ventricosus TaxID=182803 RepID=A0A4Y2INN1_ARAVE|nr:hypothetical protein AVEN_104200-1 [Araneus ventricosus]